MRNFTWILLLFVTFSGFSQKEEVSHTVIEKIKKDVWIPFMESYATLDPMKLQSIHDKDIVRIFIDDNRVESGQSYLDGFGGFLSQVQENDGELGIAFAILSTAFNSSKDLAYQTGYYEFSSKGKDEPSLTVKGYGQFSVGLRKSNGSWKLFLDSDKRIKISSEDFQNQEIVYRLP